MLSIQAIQNQYDKLTPDKQAEFRQRTIYNIVDKSYGDRITDFTVDPTPKSGAITSGSFATPRLGGKKLVIDYAIKDSGVTLTPRNLEIIDHGEISYSNILKSLFSFAESIGYAPVEYFDFARVLKCEKGWACGGACLSKTKKNCHQALNPEHKTYAGWLKSQVDKGAALHKGHRDEAEKLGLTKKQQTQEEPKTTNTPPAKELKYSQVEKQAARLSPLIKTELTLQAIAQFKKPKEESGSSQDRREIIRKNLRQAEDFEKGERKIFENLVDENHFDTETHNAERSNLLAAKILKGDLSPTGNKDEDELLSQTSKMSKVGQTSIAQALIQAHFSNFKN